MNLPENGIESNDEDTEEEDTNKLVKWLQEAGLSKVFSYLKRKIQKFYETELRNDYCKELFRMSKSTANTDAHDFIISTVLNGVLLCSARFRNPSHDFHDCNPTGTQVDANQKLSAAMSSSNGVERMKMGKVPYMQAVGCLLFAAQVTRPDINFAVNLLSRYSSSPGKAHWTTVKRVMRYYIWFRF